MERLGDLVLFGHVAADTLQLDDTSLIVHDRVVRPSLPGRVAAGRDDLLVLLESLSRGRARGQSPQEFVAIGVGQKDRPFRPDELAGPLVEGAAVRLVHERQGRIGQEPANHLGLRLDDVAVSLLALPEFRHHPAPGAHHHPEAGQKADRQDRERDGVQG